MIKYHRLARSERYQIEALLRSGSSLREISRILGRSPSTVSRERRRNSSLHENYRANRAHKNSEKRRLRSHPERKVIQGSLETKVRECLKLDWSPEQIEGRLKIIQPRVSRVPSFLTIYRYIYRCSKERDDPIYLHLRQRHRQRVPRKRAKKAFKAASPYKKRLSITARPLEVLARNRIGDYERDTLLGKQHGASILTIVDRASRLTRLSLMGRKSALNAHLKTVELLKGHSVLSITNDNGIEFKFDDWTAKELNTKIYFTHPHSPWQRGTNENTNGLLRQYFRRSSDLALLTEEKVKEVEDKINTRPRKVLGYKTPIEVFNAMQGSGVAIAV